MFYHFNLIPRVHFIGGVGLSTVIKHKILECHHTIIILTAAAVETVPQAQKIKTNRKKNVAATANHRAVISSS